MSGATKISGELQAGTSGTTDSSAMETEEYYNPEGGEWSQKVDTGQLCRVCANPNEYLIPIFDGEGLEHELSVKIEKHLPIKVTETDALPQQMCYQCASTLIAWHDLVLNCVEADKKLRELQADEDDDDDDKGAEMFESHSMDSDPADEVDQPSTSESQITAKLQVPKKTVLSKDKKPKLKMVLVKGSLAGTSGQKTVAKTQVAKALELAKSKEGGNEDSASERYQTSFKDFCQQPRDAVLKHETAVAAQIKSPKLLCLGIKVDDTVRGDANYIPGFNSNTNNISLPILQSEENSADVDEGTSDKSFSETGDNNLSTSETDDELLQTDDEPSDMIALDDDKTPFSCEYCGKIFKRKDYLREHIKVHLELRPYICHLCGKQYRKRFSMKSHIQRVHDKKKNYECDICGKKFGYKESRDDHRRSHTGERPLMCDKCGKSFMSHTSLYVHKRTHTDYFPFSCTYCNKKFRTRSTLNIHTVTHTGEKHHTCDLCGKSFGTRGVMVEHRRIHSGERPFACELCGRCFKRREHLKAHKRTHKELLLLK